MKITALNQFLLIEPLTEEKTKSGLIVGSVKGEDKTEAVAIRGRVAQIPEKTELKNIKVGDEVFVAKWEAQKAIISGKSYIIIEPKHLLVKVER